MRYPAAYAAGRKAYLKCVSFSTYEHSPNPDVREAYNQGYRDAKQERRA